MSAESQEEALKRFEEKLESLLRGTETDLDAYLVKIESQPEIAETKASVYCYVMTHDGNDRPRLKDLAKAVATRVVDYAIPRSEILKARDHMLATNSMARIFELNVKAKSLFTDLATTGEGGEMLLYMLAQAKLRLPQVLCKMSLKTNPRVHYHGADAIHMAYDRDEDRLAIYWGEAKLHASISKAVSECMDSIKPFLCNDGGTDSRQNRDLQLLSNFMDLGDSELEDALVRYLDPDDPMYNKLQHRGVCLIGFNDSCYPRETQSKRHQDVITQVETAITDWQSRIGTDILSRSPLCDFRLEIFLIPFPSVGNFRTHFLGEVNNG